MAVAGIGIVAMDFAGVPVCGRYCEVTRISRVEGDAGIGIVAMDCAGGPSSRQGW